MSVASELSRLQQAKSDLATSITNKGVTVPSATTIDGYAALVDQIQQGGGTLPYDAEIEYLETNTLASINSRVHPTSLNITIEFYSCRLLPFGWEYNSNGNGTWICIWGGKAYWKNYSSSYTVSGATDEIWNVWKYDMQSGLYENGTLIKSFTASLGNSAISDMPLYLGDVYDRNKGALNNSAISASRKIGWCKIFVGGTLTRDYIPVRIGQVGYLYDKVSGELFSNVGTGSFTLGPDVV